MSRYDREQPAMAFPRPGRALWGVMIVLFTIWLAFAIGQNWGKLDPSVFMLFVGDTRAVLGGQVWRLATAPLVHLPTVGGIFFPLLGLYFLTPTLEETWGGARLIRFLMLSSVFAYLFQVAVELALPASLAAKLVPGGIWFSSLPALEAISIAWALTFRGQTVRLFFLLPVSSRGLILFVVGASILLVVTLEAPMCGLIAPFGGMLAGWGLGGGTPSPLRRAWLRLRLKKLERQEKSLGEARQRRVARSGLKVIEGGKKNGSGDDDGQGPDGTLLN
jgi:membrane associated rhomboid family serine protease